MGRRAVERLSGGCHGDRSHHGQPCLAAVEPRLGRDQDSFGDQPAFPGTVAGVS